MTIIKTNSLTDAQKCEIGQLEQAAYKKYRLCNHAFLSNDINFNRRMPCFFMGYVGERLVSFLSVFVPTKLESEIVAFTHPDFQNKGCFTQLFDEARKVLISVGIGKVLFAVEPGSKNAQAVLKTIACFEIERSEYRMAVSSLKHAPKCDDLQLFEVDNSNKEMFKHALSVVFPEDGDMDNFYDAVVSTDIRHGYILYKDRPIGIFNISTEHEDAILYGVGIASEFRGRGYGKQLMGHAMREGMKLSNRLVLDVDSNNPIAYNMYKKCGFKTEFQVDYYLYNVA